MSNNKTKKFCKFESLEAKKLFAADLAFTSMDTAELSVNGAHESAEFRDSNRPEQELKTTRTLVPTIGAGSGLRDDWTSECLTIESVVEIGSQRMAEDDWTNSFDAVFGENR